MRDARDRPLMPLSGCRTCRGAVAGRQPRLRFVVDDFIRGLAMMRKHDPQVQEDGFGLVKGVAAAHVAELSSAYAEESDHGLRCWLLELLGETRSPEALPVLVEALDSPDESIRHWGEVGLKKADTRESRRLLWQRAANNDP